MTTKSKTQNKIDFTPRAADYIVPRAMAANIRTAMNAKNVEVSQGTPVFFAKKSREVSVSDAAINKGVRNDPVRCIEAVQCKQAGTPAIVTARHVWVRERTRTGKPVIMLYAKDTRATDKFDHDGKPIYKFLLRKWPDSWFPRYRTQLAAARASEIKGGAKISKRKSKSGKGRTTPLRITAADLMAQYAEA